MSQTPATAPAPTAPRRTRMIVSALAVIVLAGIAFDTTVVKLGSENDVRQQAFSPEAFGASEFPRIQAFVEEHAVDAKTIAEAALADKAAAAEKYGTKTSTGAVVPVRLTGIVGEGKSGVYDLTVDGLPAEVHVRVQTGPAINGTELRDVPGDIVFGQFTNQIEYQNAGSAINKEMKKQILDAVDTTALPGKTVEVTGAFRLVNPKNWLITPVRIAVK